MPTQSGTQVHTTVTGGKNEVTVVVHNSGQVPLPPSAGQSAIVTKGGASQVVSVHGMPANTSIVFDSPA